MILQSRSQFTASSLGVGAWPCLPPSFKQSAKRGILSDKRSVSVALWAWELYTSVSHACAELPAGDRGRQRLRGKGLVRSVRQHRNVVFLDVGDPVSKAEAKKLQVVVSLETAGVAPTELLKPGILLSICGSPGRTRRGQESLFADWLSVEGIATASPSLLAALLSCALTGVVRRRDLSRWLQVTEGELEEVLNRDEDGRRGFCSRRARYLQTGREQRARQRPRSVTAEEHQVVKTYGSWAEVLRRNTVPLPSDTSLLGPADPVENLGGIHAHLKDYASRKKRPQVRAMTKLVAELRELRKQPCEVVDVGGGRGDLALAVAALVPGTRVSVVEQFAPSAHQGRNRARDLNLDVDFCISSAKSLSTVLEAQKRRPIVMALHACGGLTDVALEVCAKLRLPFCICPCCYASLPHLRARELAPQEQVLQRLAESNGLLHETSQSAVFAINAIRLHHLDPVQSNWKSTPSLPASWIVRAYTFPRQFSCRNLILWGHPREYGQQQSENQLGSAGLTASLCKHKGAKFIKTV